MTAWIALGALDLGAIVFGLSLANRAGRPTQVPPPMGTDARPPTRPVTGSLTVARVGHSPARRAHPYQTDRRPGMSGPEAS